jgi:GH15 family glucan-1,4-alpha-glucosidase
MARSLLLGNGRFLLNFDDRHWIRDVYFPRIGIENHAEGYPFRVGIWVDGETHWSDSFQRDIRYEEGTLVGRVTLRHPGLGVEVRIRDAVDFEADVLCRQFTVRDLRGHARRARIFLHHDFHVGGSAMGDTVLYDPEIDSLIHYKVNRYFLIGGGVPPRYGLSEWATGKKRFGGAEGTWRDAEGDGTLSRNPISQGSVDSTISLEVDVPARGEAVTYAWLAAAERYGEVLKLDQLIRKVGPAKLIARTAAYWRLWLRKHEIEQAGLAPELLALYQRSLLVMRLHVDPGGAIIAAADSDITHFARDTYTYMWPRDGALVADAFDHAGYPAVTRRFYDFAGRLIKKEGYFLHKYHPDRSLASSWHPWVDERGEKILPIQEDETALVVWALWRHFERWREVEEVQPLYRSFILKAAEFMADYRDPATGLPLPSWDLWEERRGVITFTCAAVWAGLDAAARFGHAFGDLPLALHYGRAADELRQGILDHLWDAERGRFLRMIVPADPQTGAPEVRDAGVDASLFGLHFLGFLPESDPRLVATLEAVAQGLAVHTEVAGLARYRGDYYHAVTQDWDRVPGNPWFVPVCWLARWRIARARTPQELEEALATLQWVVRRATPAGLLPEQIHPFTGEPVAVTPLVWSHASFVTAIHDYLQRKDDLAGRPTGARRPGTASP